MVNRTVFARNPTDEELGHDRHHKPTVGMGTKTLPQTKLAGSRTTLTTTSSTSLSKSG